MKAIARRIIELLLKVFYFFPVNKKTVYLVNFNGTSYGFEAKAFAEYLKKYYPSEYKIIWEVTDYTNFQDINGIVFVKKNSLEAIYYSLTAGLLLFNTTPRSYLPYRKEQYIVETWHGYPFKKVGKYAIRYNKKVYSIPTVYSSHSDFYEKNVINDSFEYYGRILNCGSPRNDIFFDDDCDELKSQIKARLNVQNKKIAIYAPTFRGDFTIGNIGLDFDNVKTALESRFGGEWIVLFRYHPMAIAQLGEKYEKASPNDVSFYADMQELLLVADVLISDYSGSIWDFSLQRKPVFLFTPDLDEYSSDRGLYYPHEKLPYPIARDEAQTIEAIGEFDVQIYLNKLEEYFLKMGCHENGTSCKTILQDYLRYNEGKKVKN